MVALPASPHSDSGALQQHARVRARLLECGMRVFAESATDADVLPRVAAMAQAAPAQVREHFHTADELLRSVADALSNELIMIIEGSAGGFVDAAKRIACGVRIYLQTACECPLFAKFVARAGFGVAGPLSPVQHYLPGHITSGTQTARFAESTARVGMDLITGTTLAAVVQIAAGPVPPHYPEQIAAAILRGLGVPGKQAQRLSIVELPRIEPGSGTLLARARAIPDASSVHLRPISVRSTSRTARRSPAARTAT
jgi:AcrR family transcriptional regulator